MAGPIQRLTDTHAGTNVTEGNLDRLCIDTFFSEGSASNGWIYSTAH
jgi:hypothetical protein